MAAGWFCELLGKEVGPLSVEQLRAMVQRGRLTGEHVVKQGPDGQWTKIAQIADLQPLIPPPAVPISAIRIPPPPPAAQLASAPPAASPGGEPLWLPPDTESPPPPWPSKPSPLGPTEDPPPEMSVEADAEYAIAPLVTPADDEPVPIDDWLGRQPGTTPRGSLTSMPGERIGLTGSRSHAKLKRQQTTFLLTVLVVFVTTALATVVAYFASREVPRPAENAAPTAAKVAKPSAPAAAAAPPASAPAETPAASAGGDRAAEQPPGPRTVRDRALMVNQMSPPAKPTSPAAAKPADQKTAAATADTSPTSAQSEGEKAAAGASDEKPGAFGASFSAEDVAAGMAAAAGEKAKPAEPKVEQMTPDDDHPKSPKGKAAAQRDKEPPNKSERLKRGQKMPPPAKHPINPNLLDKPF
jgi:hypothetical protein